MRQENCRRSNSILEQEQRVRSAVTRPTPAIAFDFCSFSRMRLTSKCSGGGAIFSFYFGDLQALHQIRTVERSGEYRP